MDDEDADGEDLFDDNLLQEYVKFNFSQNSADFCIVIMPLILGWIHTKRRT